MFWWTLLRHKLHQIALLRSALRTWCHHAYISAIDRLYLCSQKCILKFIIPASNQFNSCKVYIQDRNQTKSSQYHRILGFSVCDTLFSGYPRWPVTPNISNARIMASGEGLVCRIAEPSTVGVGYVLIRKFLSYMKGIGTEEGKGKAGTPFFVDSKDSRSRWCL